MICPNCKSNLEGGLIFDTFMEQYGDRERALSVASGYGATETAGRWGREIRLYDLVKDRTTGFRCPDCGHEWRREEHK